MLAAIGLTRLPSLARLPFSLQFSAIMISAFVIGGAIELIQPFFGRSASWIDMGFNLFGGFIGLVFFAPARLEMSRKILLSFQIGAVVLASLIFHGPMTTLWDMHVAARQFPVLSDFETRFEAKRWTAGVIDTSLARTGNASLRVELGTDRYSGTTLWRSFGNWQGYTTLVISIYNPEPKPIAMTITIRDEEHSRRGGEYHDRFNREFMLRQGWNDIRIPTADIKNAPAQRTMDLSMLTYLVVFAMNLSEVRTIYLDYVHLISA